MMPVAIDDHLTMRSFNEYEELSVDSVVDFALPYLTGDPVGASDISDGNINRVFRVTGEKSSVIVKQALPYLRVAGRAWPLTRHRIITENSAFRIHDSLVPAAMPEILHFDQEMCAIVMEDLHAFQPWREALLQNHDSAHVPRVVAEYCSEILIRTSNLVLDESEQRDLKKKFYYTELCLVTEELFFTAPYVENKTNRFDVGLEVLVAQLQSDEALRGAASEMRTIFKTKDQALIHGDLHSGSVMVSEDQVRIIDLEFAFYGPFGFDLGVLFANLALSKIAHEALGNSAYCVMIDSYAREIWSLFNANLLVLSSKYFFDVDQFRNNMEHDMYRFAGMEMIRRIVGLAHAKEIDLLPDSVRLQAQVRAILNGKTLLVNSSGFDFDRFWQTAIEEVSNL
jgi:5-methylthioribose kinase